jgi:dimethylaniline monooxygenase (N-oxide forming)
VSKLGPCIFEPLDNWKTFFHGNLIGRWLVDGIWAAVGWSWRKTAGYPRVENMKGWKLERPVFWSSDAAAVVNSRGMWDSVANVK